MTDDTSTSARARQLGLAGAAALALGVFLPVARIPVVGSVNYFHNGTGDGVLLLVLAGLALVAAFLHTGWLLPPGVTGAAALLLAFLSFRNTISESQASLERQLEGNPFAGMAVAVAGSAQLEWGWAVMFLGAGLLLAGSLIDRRPPLLAWVATALMLVPIGMYAYVVL